LFFLVVLQKNIKLMPSLRLQVQRRKDSDTAAHSPAGCVIFNDYSVFQLPALCTFASWRLCVNCRFKYQRFLKFNPETDVTMATLSP